MSCGKKDDKNSKGEGESPKLSLFEQLSAEWVGSYKAMNDGKVIGEPSLAQATFAGDGTFRIAVQGEAIGGVEGQWNEFQGETLILRIVKSDISRIGSPGKIVEPLYELIGSGLRVMGANFELNLTRKSQSTDGPGSASGKTKFIGGWICDDGLGRKTKMVVTDSDTYLLSSVKANERIFTSEGKATLQNADSLKLTADVTSDPLAPDSFFVLEPGGDRLELKLNRPGSDPVSFGICQK